MIYNSAKYAVWTFDEAEQGKILGASKELGAPDVELVQRLKNYYTANFDEDLASVVEMFEEDRAIAENEALNTSKVRAEIIRRFIKDEENNEDHPLETSLDWLSKHEVVTTRRAFELAYAKETVIQLYADGTDSQLDCMEIEEDYFPDKSKSWPEIETIFLTEKK